MKAQSFESHMRSSIEENSNKILSKLKEAKASCKTCCYFYGSGLTTHCNLKDGKRVNSYNICIHHKTPAHD